MKIKELSVLSIKSLFIEMYYGDILLSSGSSFIIESALGDVLITNRHNVTGRDQNTGETLNKWAAIPNKLVLHIFYLKNGLPSPLKHEIELYENEKPVWFEHPTLCDRADVVVIPIKGLPVSLEREYKFKIGNLDVSQTNVSHRTNDGDFPLKVSVSDRVCIIGYPLGLRVENILPVWMNGFIASEINFNVNDLPVFLVDARTRQGQSGSPVVRIGGEGMVKVDTPNIQAMMMSGSTSRFLGIYSGRINKDSDLGYVWKASMINEIIDSYVSIMNRNVN